MDAETFLTNLQARGFVLSITVGGILVSPSKLLTEEDRAAIRQHKPALLALLALQGTQQTSCATCGQSLTIETRSGWLHRYCTSGEHRFDEWTPVAPERAPLSQILGLPSPAAGLQARLDGNQTPCCGARWTMVTGLRLCVSCKAEWPDADLQALAELLNSKAAPVAA